MELIPYGSEVYEKKYGSPQFLDVYYKWHTNLSALFPSFLLRTSSLLLGLELLASLEYCLCLAL